MALYDRVLAYSRHNPACIEGRADINYLGCTRNPVGVLITFQSTVYGLRAFFSLMRYWQRSKSASTVEGFLSNVYWLSDETRFSLSSVICARTGFEPSTLIDYHSHDARLFVAAFCRAVSGIDNIEEQIALAQNMIL